MRKGLVVLSILLVPITTASAQVSVAIGVPGISIGINLPAYPQLVPVPGYPVYYAPQLDANYFFYDGMYWVYQQDNWYASSWYDGPWALVAPEAVPLFILRIPVRYYRRPPVYFRGWASDAPPRWGEHWGNAWEQHHRGWDNWNRRAVPARAPLPAYQRQYSGNRYPSVVQQQLQTHNYRYQPRDAVVRQHYQAQRAQSHPPPSVQGATRAPRGQPPQSGSREVQQRAAPAPSHQGGPTSGPQRQQAGRAVPQHQQQAPRSQNHGHAQEPKRGQTKGGDQGDQRGGERNR